MYLQSLHRRFSTCTATSSKSSKFNMSSPSILTSPSKVTYSFLEMIIRSCVCSSVNSIVNIFSDNGCFNKKHISFYNSELFVPIPAEYLPTLTEGTLGIIFSWSPFLLTCKVSMSLAKKLFTGSQFPRFR